MRVGRRQRHAVSAATIDESDDAIAFKDQLTGGFGLWPGRMVIGTKQELLSLAISSDDGNEQVRDLLESEGRR